MKQGVLIMGHGSAMPRNKEVIDTQAALLRGKGFENVRVGFNESTRPGIPEALDDMAADGVTDVVCLPFFIASGLHLTRDIPAKLGIPPGASEAIWRANGRSMRVILETPFGEDPLLTDLLEERIRESDEGRSMSVLLVAHGSRLPHNKAVAEGHAAELRRRGYDVRAAFNELSDPGIEEAVSEIMASGAEHMAVAPLFISTGKHLASDVPPRVLLDKGSVRAVRSVGGRDVLITFSEPIGSDPRLADVLARKVRRHC